MKNIIGIIVGGLWLDCMGFLAWVYSGQVPPQGYWLGRATYEFLKVVLNIN